jgi:hypothetical protein
MSIIPTTLATERRRSTQSNEKITEVCVNGCFSIIAKLIHKNNVIAGLCQRNTA